MPPKSKTVIRRQGFYSMADEVNSRFDAIECAQGYFWVLAVGADEWTEYDTWDSAKSAAANYSLDWKK